MEEKNIWVSVSCYRNIIINAELYVVDDIFNSDQRANLRFSYKFFTSRRMSTVACTFNLKIVVISPGEKWNKNNRRKRWTFARIVIWTHTVLLKMETRQTILALASPSINMNFLVMVLWAVSSPFDNIRPINYCSLAKAQLSSRSFKSEAKLKNLVSRDVQSRQRLILWRVEKVSNFFRLY